MRLINFLPLIISAIVIIYLGISINSDDYTNSKSYIYTLSKQELTLTSGETLKLEDFKGEYYLIHLFSSWCSACHDDFSLLTQIKNTTKIPLIGIAVNDKLEKLVKKENLPYDFVSVDIDNKILKTLQNKFLPETIIINKQGIVEFRYLGALSKEEVEKNIIPTLLSKK